MILERKRPYEDYATLRTSSIKDVQEAAEALATAGLLEWIFPFLPNRHADICYQPKYGLASASTSLLPVIGVLIDTSKMLPNNLFVNTALL